MLHARLRAAAGRSDIPQDFVARYLFESLVGDVVVDESGNYDGTSFGATLVSGPGGLSAISLGDGKRVSIPTTILSALGSGAGTVSFALRRRTSSGLEAAISAANSGASNQYSISGLGASTQDHKPRMIHSDSGATARIALGEQATTIDQWHHIIFRTDGSRLLFRMDGSNLSKTQVAGTDVGEWIGDASGFADNVWMGRLQRSTISESPSFEMSVMTLYGRELSDDECQTLESEWM